MKPVRPQVPPHPNPLPRRGEGTASIVPEPRDNTEALAPLSSGGEGRERVATKVRGARRSRGVGTLTKHAREMRKTPTLAEKLLWSRLRSQRNGLVFRRQQVICPFIVDFYCSNAKLVIELDGWSHDDTVAYDESRTEWLESEGFTVVRISNFDLIADPSATASALFAGAEALVDGLPHPRFTLARQDEGSPHAPPHPSPVPPHTPRRESQSNMP